MIRRVVGVVAAAAVSLLLSVSAAHAYPAPEITITVSDTSPTVGVPFTVSASDLADATEATLTITSDDSIPDSAISIAGTQALAKPVVEGAVSWTVTLNEAGTYTLTVTTDTGATVTQVVTATEADEGGLPGTGASSLPFVALAAGLVLLGALAVLLVRRARTR